MFLARTGTLTCGATLLDTAYAYPLMIRQHGSGFDNGGATPSQILAVITSFPLALGSPFNPVFPVALSPPATLCTEP